MRKPSSAKADDFSLPHFVARLQECQRSLEWLEITQGELLGVRARKRIRYELERNRLALGKSR